MIKLDALEALQNAWGQCRACGLCEERKNVVFGYGNPHAQVMIIGEAPGENEDREGYPFIGAAGQLLDQYLGMSSARVDVQDTSHAISKDKKNQQSLRRELRYQLLYDFYFTNVVMCRPPENRDPIPKELEACRTRLYEQIYIVDPVLIITAGGIATTAILGKKVSITQVRGDMYDVAIPGRTMPLTYPVLPILHPSYLLRKNDFNQANGDGQKTYNDMIRAMGIVDKVNESHYDQPIPSTRPKKEKK